MTQGIGKVVGWQQQLADCVEDPVELFNMLDIDQQELSGAMRAIQSFALRVPRSFVARMKLGDINDPLLRQVLPLGEELQAHPGFTQDPLNELAQNPVPGLLHKYQGRVLLTVAGACAINCRYCFRRHYPYQDNIPGTKGWQLALDYIASDTSIREVIYSGGDPLVAKDNVLENLTSRIAAIAHVQVLRIHTRLPVVLPARVCDRLLNWLQATRLKTVLVIHANHANEINREVTLALKQLRAAGITLLNQSVLLKDVNDSVSALAELSWALFDNGVMPYYLHLLDAVAGAAHFNVDQQQAVALHQQLRHKLPGYLVPKLVKEMPGELSKLPII